MGVVLLSPTNGCRLMPQSAHLLSDGERLWPVVEGIAYLRPKEELRQAVVGALRADRHEQAVRLLLADQDRFSPTAPPDAEALDVLLDAGGDLTLRRAMQLLNFGPVADYFAYRWCSPTFLGGLRLLELSVPAGGGGGGAVEYACGIGHFLRELEAMSVPTVGVDIVWAKLWLARRFMGVRGRLVCGDVEVGTVIEPAGQCTVFCHDAFYFFEHKQAAIANMRRVAAGGRVAVGHVHTQLDRHEAGFSESLEGYGRLTGSVIQDDSSCVNSWFTHQQLRQADAASAAIAWREGGEVAQDSGLHFTPPSSALHLNPLLSHDGFRWPSPGWRREYEEDAQSIGVDEAAAYREPVVQQLMSDPQRLPTLSVEEREWLYRHQVLLNLPARW